MRSGVAAEMRRIQDGSVDDAVVAAQLIRDVLRCAEPGPAFDTILTPEHPARPADG